MELVATNEIGLDSWPDVGALVARYTVRDDPLDGVEVAQHLHVGPGEVAHVGALEIRRADKNKSDLPSGRYLFRRGEGQFVLDVVAGASPFPPFDATPGDAAFHLFRTARDWVDEEWWPNADVVGRPPLFSKGDRVERTGDKRPWTVIEVRQTDNGVHYRIEHGSEHTIANETTLQPAAPIYGPSDWVMAEPCGAAATSVAITLAKLTTPLTDVVYSYLASRTVFRPYQFRPVMKMISGTSDGLLIADEVGLGKTIEAGLIWTELAARDPSLQNVLIVCPAALREKWRREMAQRFNRDVPILNNEGIGEVARKFEEHRTGDGITAIVSIEGMRISGHLERLTHAGARFDLVIIDEAHAMRNRATQSHLLGQQLVSWADHVLMLSATPLNLHQQDLFNLVQLLDETMFPDFGDFMLQLEPTAVLNHVAAGLIPNRDEPRKLLPALKQVDQHLYGGTVTRRAAFGDLRELLDQDRLTWFDIQNATRLVQDLHALSGVVTRTRKVDVAEDQATRVPMNLDVQWTPREAAAYLAVKEYVVAKAVANDHPVGLVTQMPCRMAASCLQAYRSRLGADADEHGDDLGVDDWESSDVNEWDDDSVHETGTVSRARRQMLDAFERLGTVDTKFDVLAQTLRDATEMDGRPVLLFAFFKDTLRYLERRLSPDWRVARMDGDTDMHERQRIMGAFRRGEFDILLASEVASEGLDFEFAGVIVNYDLPWNPMRVEQRVGRLDRFGQKHERIFILNFSIPGTIETDIVMRLYQRLHLFESAIGELEPILRDVHGDLTKLAFDPKLTPEELDRRISQMAVAIEGHRADLDELDEARAELAAIDDVLIKDFEHRVSERGRFVGPLEVATFVDQFLRASSAARLRRTGDEVTLVGDKELARRVSDVGSRNRTHRVSPSMLADIRAGEPIELTISNEDRRADVDLLSHSHPITRAAVHYFGHEVTEPDRFGSVGIEGERDRSWFVLIARAEVIGGVRDDVVLWGVGIDLRNGEVSEDIADRFLAAQANGRLTDRKPEGVLDVADALESAQQFLMDKLGAETAARQRSNEERIDIRIQQVRNSTETKIANRRRQLKDATVASIVRMHEGTIRNLQTKADEEVARLETRRALAVSVNEVFAAVVNETSGGTRD